VTEHWLLIIHPNIFEEPLRDNILLAQTVGTFAKKTFFCAHNIAILNGQTVGISRAEDVGWNE